MPSTELISRNPCTDEIVWRGPIASAADVDRAVSSARRAFAVWAGLEYSARAKIAALFRDHVQDQSEAFARVIAEETGKPLWEARTEVASVAAKVDISMRAYQERSGDHAILSGSITQRLRHKPHGILAVVGPYNFPAHLPNGHIVPALLAGNAVLFKPSELTPHTAQFMMELWRQAGLPADVLQLVMGGGDTGKSLAAHAGLDGLLFTGSARTGFALHRQFADAPHKILALEMGGNNPLVAWDVADIEAAATLIAVSAFQSAGQRCTCARRLILEDSSHGAGLVEAVIAVAKRMRIGAPFDDPPCFMGPVINTAAADQLQAAWQAIPGRPLLPLMRPEADRSWLTPSIIDVTDNRNRPDQELFGPVLQVVRVPDFDAALAEANNTRFGLAAGLIGGDEQLFDTFWKESRAGIVNWNRPLTGASSAAPFGGIGASGNHRPSAYYAADYAAFPVAGLEQATLAAVEIPGLLP